MTTSDVWHIWDNSECEGTQDCPPRCPRFFDKRGEPMLVREFRSGDYDPLLEMYTSLEAADQTMGVPPQKTAALRQWLNHILTDGWNLIAAHSDRIVGHAAVTPKSEDEPEFVIFVHRDYRDRGIGTELVKQVLAYAETMEHRNIVLDVARTNERAINVYESLGFDIVSETKMHAQMRMPLRKPDVRAFQRPPANRRDAQSQLCDDN
ncbi:GNAT family N-acetyltransferase [Haloarcula brevis]|uniref:GNAT family N-acetyltransferase n=1 Tax=Haloarcula brevis TaxID=3111453 RepID=UPI00300F701D